MLSLIKETTKIDKGVNELLKRSPEIKETKKMIDFAEIRDEIEQVLEYGYCDKWDSEILQRRLISAYLKLIYLDLEKNGVSLS